MNTNDSKLLKERIHWYFHRTNVTNPAIGKKNEYQSRVSPIVRKGGLSRDNHIPAINTENMNNPAKVKTTDLR